MEVLFVSGNSWAISETGPSEALPSSIVSASYRATPLVGEPTRREELKACAPKGVPDMTETVPGCAPLHYGFS
jgi:hypothetical protein